MTDKEINCEPCSREELKVPANSYCYECSEKICEYCVKLHKKIKSLSNHELCNLGGGDVARFEFLKSLTMCPKHLTEEVRYICKDHDQLCCNECAIARHRKCDQMISLADELSKLEINEHDMDFRLGEILDGSKMLTDHETKHQSIVQASTMQIRYRLTALKEKIDEAFCKMEVDILQDVEDRSAKILKKSKSQEEGIETLKAEINRSRGSLRTAQKYCEKLHLFVVERKLKTELKRHEDALQNLQRDSSVKILTLVDTIFEQNLMKTIASCSHLEEVISRSPEPSSTEIVDLIQFVDPVLSEIALPVSSGAHEASSTEIVDITQCVDPVLSEMALTVSSGLARTCVWIGNFVVVGLQEMKQLQLFDINKESLKYIKTENVSSEPWSLRKLDESRFAVCYPHNNSIELMKINKGTCETEKTLNIRSDIWDISFNKLKDHIIGLSWTIDVIDFNGTIVNSVALTQETSNIVKSAYGICFDTDNNVLYISSYARHEVVAVKLDGIIVFKYTCHNLRYPLQPDIDAEGNIHIPYFGGIHKIDRNGKLLREIQLPGHGFCVRFNSSKTKFIVTYANPHGIRIYNLK